MESPIKSTRGSFWSSAVIRLNPHAPPTEYCSPRDAAGGTGFLAPNAVPVNVSPTTKMVSSDLHKVTRYIVSSFHIFLGGEERGGIHFPGGFPGVSLIDHALVHCGLTRTALRMATA